MNTNMFNALGGFTESIQQIQAAKLNKQQEISRKTHSGEFFYGGFILAKDSIFKEALSYYEWDCVSEWHDNARVIIPLPPPNYGGIVLYRLKENKFCAKVLIGFSYEATFDTWFKLKNFCISRGLFLPPISNDTKGVASSADAFAERLNDMDEIMFTDVNTVFEATNVTSNSVSDSDVTSAVKTDMESVAEILS